MYEGTLDDILSEILEVLRKESRSKRDYSVLAFHTPRIIRALVDCKEDHREDSRYITLLRSGISTSLCIYKEYDEPATQQRILDLRDDILQLDESILARRVFQTRDDINLVASDPRFSCATTKRLQELIGSEPAIFFAVGHGSLGIGLDVVLRYQELSGHHNLQFYPVRFSRTESKGYSDTTPCLTDIEINYLKNEVKGKRIIVFDENHNTGKAVRTVADFISRNVACGQNVDIVYNVNTSIPGELVELYERLQERR